MTVITRLTLLCSTMIDPSFRHVVLYSITLTQVVEYQFSVSMPISTIFEICNLNYILLQLNVFVFFENTRKCMWRSRQRKEDIELVDKGRVQFYMYT